MLNAVLMKEFPVNVAFKAAAARRDDLLDRDHPSISETVAAILHRKVEAIGAARNHWRTWPFKLLGLLQSPGTAAVVAGCLLMVAATLYFAQWRFPRPNVAEQNHLLTAQDSLLGRLAGTFPKEGLADRLPQLSSLASPPSYRTVSALNYLQRVCTPRNQFNLRISTTELVCLRTSFLTANHTYPGEMSDAPVAVRLDLPVRSIFLDGDNAGIP
ncbi:MAG TPA: hypothetical protein VEP30_02640 [Chthoniobacterales bacterium]|nr:hypothetical protein [Chthoniobacterales bacterium]